MSKQYDKIKTVRKICTAAKLYKANLVGKKYLYFFDNRYIEVIYKTENFKHLTGVESVLSAKAFYKLAIKGELAGNQIYFSSSHPYELCQRKLKHLDQIASLAKAESFMLEEIKTATRTYKFGTTDLNFSLCFNQQYDKDKNLINEVFHAESLRDEDCFSKSTSVYAVNVILFKPNTEKKYDHIAFLDKSCGIDKLPSDVLELCTDDLLDIIKCIRK